jgi:choline dehydrogenase
MSTVATTTRDAEVIVVGAGSAGIVVASRLAQAGRSVLLVEAGEWMDTNEAVSHPQAWTGLQGSDVDWKYATEPAIGVSSRVFDWPRGLGVGGSGSINAMIWLRSHPADYDAWAEAGNLGWSYEDLLPYFRRSETWAGGAADHHGSDGPIHAEFDPAPSKAATAFLRAAKELRIAENSDFNSGDIEGAGLLPHSIREGSRESSATAYFPNRELPEGLEIRTGTRVRRLLIERGTAVGIEVVDAAGARSELRAGEVVLSAGTIGSPQLLMLSGIGPHDELSRHGIETVVDLPVGMNLQDHIAATMMIAAEDLDVDPRSPLGEAALFASSPLNPAEGPPDLQITVIPVGPRGVGSGFMLTPALTRPRSRGRIRLRSTDPADLAVIETGYLTEAVDRDVLRHGLRLAFDLLAQKPLADLATAWVYPDTPQVRDADLDQLIDQTLMTYYHPSGTCRMGVDEASVVDPQLRVRGIGGLRVIDASVFPTIPTANINAAVVAVAERGVDLLLGAGMSEGERPARAAADSTV